MNNSMQSVSISKKEVIAINMQKFLLRASVRGIFSGLCSGKRRQ